MADDREPYGRLVHEQRLAVNAEKEHPFVLEPWERRSRDQQEMDMRIGSAIAMRAAAAERERIAVQVDALAANYPEDVFLPDGTSRDAIGGTAMRHAYRNAAREIRSGGHGDETRPEDWRARPCPYPGAGELEDALMEAMSALCASCFGTDQVAWCAVFDAYLCVTCRDTRASAETRVTLAEQAAMKAAAEEAA